MATDQINIVEVLSRIRSGEDGEFSLVIIRASGKLKGHQKVLLRCRYGAPEQAIHVPKGQRDKAAGKRLASVGDHLENGTVPITDLEKKQYKSPLFSHIIGYSGRKVIH